MLKEEALSDKWNILIGVLVLERDHHWGHHTLPNQNDARAITQQFLIGLALSIANLRIFTQRSLAYGVRAGV